MATFAYKARNQQGDLVNGSIDVDNEQNAAAQLDKMGYSIIEIKESRSAGQGNFFQDIIDRLQRIEKQEIIFFTRQLATLIRSGMPLLPSLGTISEQTTNKKFKVILEDIRQNVQGGVSFSQALAKYPNVFSELFISMVKVGEAGGIMDQVLERLATLSTQEMEIQSKIKSAMTYPVVLVVMAFLIVNFIMVGVLPKFVMVFNASQAQLPIPTRIILGMSWAVRNYWYVFIGVFAGVFFYFQGVIASEKGKYAFHRLLLKFPIFGPLYTKIQISRFSRTIATLTRSGIPILQALLVVEKTITNVVLQKGIQNVRNAITAGSSLVEPFKATGLFSPMVIQMISIGEKSGKIDQMFEEISGFYDPEIEYTIKNLTALLEPFMLLSMGLMVGFIALSVLLPIFNLMKVFRT